MDRTQWPEFIKGLAADGATHAEISAKYFGGLVSTQTIAKWCQGSSTPRKWIVDVCSIVMKPVPPPFRVDWDRTDLDEILALPDAAYRLREVGVSKELLYCWRAGGRPPAWTIPILGVAVKTVPDEPSVEKDAFESWKAAAIAADLPEGPKRTAVEAYFGLTGEKQTLARIAETLGCSRQYVHQTIKSLGLSLRPRRK
jgi:hypothetical protein